jgi:hypothetical protein
MNMARIGIFLIIVTLIAGLVGCAQPAQYNLTISTTEGGEITTPGEGTSSYDEGTEVPLVALPHTGYRFVNWTGDVDTIANVEDNTTTITMKGDYSITAKFAVKQYSLIVESTEGGSVTTPGENAYTYEKDEVVNLTAVPDEGYEFIDWTGDVSTIADTSAASTSITMNDNYYITASFGVGIYDWYDLDAIRENLSGSYILMNDLDYNTPGYAELVGHTANKGEGWQPIGTLLVDLVDCEVVDPVEPFNGILRGRGCEIRDLFISRLDEDGVGLFGFADEGGVVENLGVINAEVIGCVRVGGLVGYNRGTVRNSYFTGSVTGNDYVGGLVGENDDGTVSNSSSSGNVAGKQEVGGLVGYNLGFAGNCYSSSSVTGEWCVGGLVGKNRGAVNNSHYDYDEVLINGEKTITIGALFCEDFEEWLSNDKFLDVVERLFQESDYYLISDIGDLIQLLAFGQDDSLKFRLKADLDLGIEPNFYIPYLAGEFDGNGHKILNLTLNLDSVSGVGLFGALASGGEVTQVSVENANIIIDGEDVGSLVGWNDGTVSNSYSTGSVTGSSVVGGLVGHVWTGIVSNSYFTGIVTGEGNIGGLVGIIDSGAVSNSHYNYDEVLINGESIITTGALFNEDFNQWLDNDKFLDVNERLSQEDGYYLINDVSDFKQLVAFGQDSSLKFRLKNDLDLDTEANFYIPYLAGEFDGNGHKLLNLSFSFDFIAQVGLFGHVAPDGRVVHVGAENTAIVGCQSSGALVGWNNGAVSNSYSTGSITGESLVGGLVGINHEGTVRNSLSIGAVAGHTAIGGLIGRNDGSTVNNCYSFASVTGNSEVGGLVGYQVDCIVSNSFSTGSVTGHEYIGGLIGWNIGNIVSNSFWDVETSGQATSSGGTGKTTTEMKSITTFTDWDIFAVASGETSPSYTWNIVDGQTYPFLSWQT